MCNMYGLICDCLMTFNIARLMNAASKRKIYVDLYSGHYFIFQMEYAIIPSSMDIGQFVKLTFFDEKQHRKRSSQEKQQLKMSTFHVASLGL